MEEKMKCYEVLENYTGYVAVVFAENASKARYYAWRNRDEFFTDNYNSFIEFCYSFSVRRLRQGDNWYKNGKRSMDWSSDDDRIILCRELGWYCLDETDYDCMECSARDYCCRYQEEKDDVGTK